MAFTRSAEGGAAARTASSFRTASAAPGGAQLAPATPSVPVEIVTADGQLQTVSFADVRAFICAKATDAECKIFLETCRQYHLNPFTKEAYLIKYDNKDDSAPASIVLGKSCYMAMAERHPAFDGFEAGVIVFARETGEFAQREGSILYEGEELIGGWAKVYRKDRSRPNYEEVKFAEYDQANSMWRKKPATMIRKVALVHALREAFPSTYGVTIDESEVNVRVDAEGVAYEVDEDTPPALPRRRRARPAAEALAIEAAPAAEDESDPFAGGGDPA